MKTITIGLLMLWCTAGFPQITLRLTAIPSTTPAAATLYVAGDFNTWDPGNAAYVMQPDGLGAYQITIPEGTGTINFKFTRGSWATVEGNATGGYLPNRTATFTGSVQTISLTVLSWEDISGSSATSTAAANVQVLNTTFPIPQLNTTRKIWLYLPPDYYTSTKTYPVLYMEDGQNLFDNATSFAGEWQVDETLNSLFNQGDYGAIVVGIDNGGSERLNEYSPWLNTQYNAGGNGDAYMQFLALNLKPYIDAHFRTKTQPQFNALIGSSMGALISAYGASKYPDLFEKVGLFSPAFWFSLNDLDNYIGSNSTDVTHLRLYFVAGLNESTTMVSDCQTIKNTFLSKGVTTNNVLTKFDSYGTHSETYWRGEFGAAYQWLFAQTNLATTDFTVTNPIIKSITNRQVSVSGLPTPTAFALYTSNGQKVETLTLVDGIYTLPSSLATGVYFLKASETTSIKTIPILIQ